MQASEARSLLTEHLPGMRQTVLEHPLGHLPWGMRLRYWNLFASAYPDACYRHEVLGYLLLKSLWPHWKNDALSNSTPYFRALMQGTPLIALEWFRRALLGDSSAADTLRKWRHELRDRSHWDCEVEDQPSACILLILVVSTVRVEFPDRVPDCFDYHRDFFDELNDEQLLQLEDLNNDHDPYRFDVEYFGAYAVSIRGDNEFDVSAWRKFWLTWLDDLLPQVQGTAAELRQALETP